MTELPLPLRTQVSASTIQLLYEGVRIQFSELPAIDGNQLVDIVLPSVESLDLSSRNLSLLDDSDAALYSNLKYLDIRRNKISKIPKNLSTLKKLKILVMSENHLKSLPDHMENLSSLTTLDISKNPDLKLLPTSLASLKRLKLVSMSSTAIEEISSNFIDFVNKAHKANDASSC